MNPDNDREMAFRGKLITDYIEAKQRLEALQAEAKNLGNRLREIGNGLFQHPDKVTPETDWLTLLDSGRVTKLVKDLSQTAVKKVDLQQKLKALGLDTVS